MFAGVQGDTHKLVGQHDWDTGMSYDASAYPLERVWGALRYDDGGDIGSVQHCSQVLVAIIGVSSQLTVWGHTLGGFQGSRVDGAQLELGGGVD